VFVGQLFTCNAAAFPAVAMIVLYVNETLVSNGSQMQNYVLESVGDYTVSCVAFNYINGTSNPPCNGTAYVSGTAEEAGRFRSHHYRFNKIQTNIKLD
jgi:hypothetical protein